jgi:hypothetical protein
VRGEGSAREWAVVMGANWPGIYWPRPRRMIGYRKDRGRTALPVTKNARVLEGGKRGWKAANGAGEHEGAAAAREWMGAHNEAK